MMRPGRGCLLQEEWKQEGELLGGYGAAAVRRWEMNDVVAGAPRRFLSGLGSDRRDCLVNDGSRVRLKRQRLSRLNETNPCCKQRAHAALDVDSVGKPTSPKPSRLLLGSVPTATPAPSAYSGKPDDPALSCSAAVPAFCSRRTPTLGSLNDCRWPVRHWSPERSNCLQPPPAAARAPLNCGEPWRG